MRRSALTVSWLLAGLLSSASAFAAPSPATPASAGAARATRLGALVSAAMAQPSPAKTGAVRKLIDHARAATDPAMHRLAVAALLKVKLPLLRDQKKEVLALVRDEKRGLLPKQMPLPKTGPVELRHYSMQGFLTADLAAIKQAGFQVTRTATGYQGTQGRFRVLIREMSEDILRDLADPEIHGVTYVGHSQIGGTVSQALAQDGLRPIGQRKMYTLLQCIGTQTLAQLKAKAPTADVITSNAPLYISEMPGLVRELYRAKVAGENYQQLGRRMASVGSNKGKLILPNQIVTLEHVDFDGNGELDIKQKPGDIEVLPAAQKLRASRLMDGVHFLASVNPYYVEETPTAVFTMAQAKVPLVARGFGRGGGSAVTEIVEEKVDGKREIHVSLNPKYKDAPDHYVGAAAVYETQLYLQKALLKVEGPRAQARALAFAGEYLELMPRSPEDAQAALDALTKIQGLKSMNMLSLSAALTGGHILNEKMVDKVAALLGQK